MKSLVYIMLFCLPLICFGQNADKGFLLEIDVEGIEVDSVLVSAAYDMQLPETIKVAVVDGKCTLKGKVNSAILAVLQPKKGTDIDRLNELYFYLDNYDYKISLSKDGHKLITKEPNQILQQKFESLRDANKAKVEVLNNKYQKLESEIKHDLEMVKLEEDYDKERSLLEDKKYEAELKLIFENNNLIAAVDRYAPSAAHGMKPGEALEQLKKFTGEAANCFSMRRLKTIIVSKLDMKEGNVLKDFPIYKPDGTSEKLLGSNGKLRFIHFNDVNNKNDFKTSQSFQRIYYKYKDKDIVFKVVRTDGNLDRLNKAIATVKFPYPVYASDGNHMDGMALNYGINIIPSFILVDKDGKLIKKDHYHNVEDIEKLLDSLISVTD